jgi:hypothetical protein
MPMSDETYERIVKARTDPDSASTVVALVEAVRMLQASALEQHARIARLQTELDALRRRVGDDGGNP